MFKYNEYVLFENPPVFLLFLLLFEAPLEDETCRYQFKLTTATPIVHFDRRRLRNQTRTHLSAMDGKTVKAIIFDLDNTLIDTGRAGDVALQKVIFRYFVCSFSGPGLMSGKLTGLLLRPVSKTAKPFMPSLDF